MKQIFFTILITLAGFNASAASFDCAKAATAIEKMICGDSQLSDLDTQLSQGYKKTMASVPNTDALKAEQRNWIAKVRNGCNDVGCLKQAYVQRISLLDGKVAQSDLATSKAFSADVASQPRISEKTVEPKKSDRSDPSLSQLSVVPAHEAQGTQMELLGGTKANKGRKVEKIMIMIPPPAEGLPDVKALTIQPDWARKINDGVTPVKAYDGAIYELKTNRNMKEASKWLAYSAYFGNIDAAELLGELYLTGLDDVYKKDALLIDAEKLFVYADSHGNTKATVRLGMLYWFGGSSVKKDVGKAIQTFERAVKNGDRQGITKLAVIAAMIDSRNPRTPDLRARELELSGHTVADEKAAYAALSRLGISAVEARKLAHEVDEGVMSQNKQNCNDSKELHAINLSVNKVDDGFRDNGFSGCK